MVAQVLRMKEAVHAWLAAQPKTLFFFPEGIKKLVQWWKKCIEKQGDYVKKWCYYKFSIFIEIKFVSVVWVNWLTYILYCTLSKKNGTCKSWLFYEQAALQFYRSECHLSNSGYKFCFLEQWYVLYLSGFGFLGKYLSTCIHSITQHMPRVTDHKENLCDSEPIGCSWFQIISCTIHISFLFVGYWYGVQKCLNFQHGCNCSWWLSVLGPVHIYMLYKNIYMFHLHKCYLSHFSLMLRSVLCFNSQLHCDCPSISVRGTMWHPPDGCA